MHYHTPGDTIAWDPVATADRYEVALLERKGVDVLNTLTVTDNFCPLADLLGPYSTGVFTVRVRAGRGPSFSPWSDLVDFCIGAHDGVGTDPMPTEDEDVDPDVPEFEPPQASPSPLDAPKNLRLQDDPPVDEPDEPVDVDDDDDVVADDDDDEPVVSDAGNDI